jgi:hypothetical protein
MPAGPPVGRLGPMGSSGNTQCIPGGGAPGAQAQRRGATPSSSDTGGSVLPTTQGLIDRYHGMGIADIGGYRQPDGYNEHSSGKALDVMVGGDEAGLARGNALLPDALSQRGVEYVIWQQKIWYPDGTSKPMEDRGSPTQNHMDHLHIKTYDQGGVLPPGYTLALNETGKPELIFTNDQAQQYMSLVDPNTTTHGTGMGA